MFFFKVLTRFGGGFKKDYWSLNRFKTLDCEVVSYFIQRSTCHFLHRSNPFYVNNNTAKMKYNFKSDSEHMFSSSQEELNIGTA